ncbi:3-dioxygenase sll1773 (Putative quercetinase) (Pirin-like protein sll1773) [Durusdinium trenchii]|uniref:3-dioxygenase sll1773 (Putative quercetinase) (Pirin-like protein sll1773) n=1 Tax=Durusdinium trenchii TaxID=1381693 RepID=A0ABP0I3B5_9DINO
MVGSMIRKVNDSDLFVSEPNPFMFGNGKNEPGNPKWTNSNWLKSRFHFSFAEYRNPRNSRFGTLRVMNDDLVQPDRGFGSHPHANMEIVTYVVDGMLTHKDSNGNEESLGRYSTQFMSAGNGVVHSEYNDSKDEPVRFIQMWIPPRKMGIPTNYGSSCGDYELVHNKWQHLVSDVQGSFQTPVKIAQDTNMYVSELDEGKTLDIHIRSDRQAYLLCIEGSVELLGKGADKTESAELDGHDAAELFGDCKLTITAMEPKSHVLVVEMPKDGSSRFA